ncbi:MAG: TonB-dependent receptor, partial [Bacteroidota bacterium]
EDVSAYYAMLTYQITDKLKFVGGARLEETFLRAESRDTSVGIGLIDESDLLPSANFIYEIIEDFNIRASYSRTIARPTMREISPFTILEPLNNNFELGNPDSLGRSTIDNYDLRFEYFLGGNELIALSAYYKDFTDPIIRTQLANTNNLFQYQNAEDGFLFGLEFELRKRLNFISEKLQNFTFVTNASYIISETGTNTPSNNPIAIRERNFIGQPDYIINAALSYVFPETGWDVALSLNRTGDRVVTIGSPSGDRRDQIALARTQLDFIASKKFNKLGLRLRILNILNDPFTTFADYKGQRYLYQDFRRGLDFRLGVTYRII